MIKNSKAQGLSLNAIIIATIVLIVLIVLVGLLTGFFGKWTLKFKDVTDTSCKGKVVDSTVGCGSGERQEYTAEADPGKICCVQIATTADCAKKDESCASKACCAGLRCSSDGVCDQLV